METIIKKAIEGGYGRVKLSSITRIDCASAHQDGYIYIQYFEHESETLKINMGMVLMDSLFWQSLFPENQVINYVELDIQQSFKTDKMWMVVALQFYHLNLTEGWDKAVKYLEDLINK